MMSAFELTVSVPQGHAFSGRASRLSLRGEGGALTILFGHAPLITSVSHGDCRILCEDGEERVGVLDGGLLSVRENRAVLLCSSFRFL